MALASHCCPDCRCALSPIRLVNDMATQGHGSGLVYVHSEAKRNLWSGKFPVQGTVEAFMCSDCGRVLLYATRHQDSFPVSAAVPQPESETLPRPASGPPD